MGRGKIERRVLHCKECGSEFIEKLTIPNQQFCSRACYGVYFHKHPSRTKSMFPCKSCGKPFPVFPAFYNRGSIIYCPECKGKRVEKRYATVPCKSKACGKQFHPRTNKVKYCSRKCWEDDHNIVTKCPCGNEIRRSFTAVYSKQKLTGLSRTMLFCSPECRHKYWTNIPIHERKLHTNIPKREEVKDATTD